MKRERLVVLDALRAVAGLTVPLFHLCEAFSQDPTLGMVFYCGHGYLAVEFFLLLMGYMLGYAYDGRWKSGMGTLRFFRQRLVRLHPLVISGVLLGLALAFVQLWMGTEILPWLVGMDSGDLLLWALWAMTMVPVFASDLLNPFNACSWTLYYEYAANILYGLFVRRLSQKVLGALTLVALFLWLSCVFHWNLNGVFGTRLPLFDRAAALTNMSIVTGWSTDPLQVFVAFVRLGLPFLLGLFLSRTGWRIRLPKGALWISLAVFAVMLYMPTPCALGGPDHLWVHGAFELLAVAVVFPGLLLVGVGAGTEAKGAAVWAFLAELSYPLYMSHYMFAHGLGIWVAAHGAEHAMPVLLLVQAAAYIFFLALACLVMWGWDRPIQAFFRRRLQH